VIAWLLSAVGGRLGDETVDVVCGGRAGGGGGASRRSSGRARAVRLLPATAGPAAAARVAGARAAPAPSAIGQRRQGRRCLQAAAKGAQEPTPGWADTAVAANVFQSKHVPQLWAQIVSLSSVLSCCAGVRDTYLLLQ